MSYLSHLYGLVLWGAPAPPQGKPNFPSPSADGACWWPPGAHLYRPPQADGAFLHPAQHSCLQLLPATKPQRLLLHFARGAEDAQGGLSISEKFGKSCDCVPLWNVRMCLVWLCDFCTVKCLLTVRPESKAGFAGCKDNEKRSLYKSDDRDPGHAEGNETNCNCTLSLF